MGDYMQDTAYMGRPYCPECEPNADPSVDILETRYCGTHGPSIDGLDDAGVSREHYLSGSNEAGGRDNQIWCDWVHRKIISEA